MSETTIYRLNYDFVQQNGHYLLISGSEQVPITSDELVRIQVNMLKANEIDRILPIEIEELDFQVKLYYNITGKKILSHRLREEKLTMPAFYQLLFQIALALEASEEYMLTENQFAIHEDFIFIGKDFKSIELLYLPIAELDEKPSLAEELRTLLFYLVGHVDELTGHGVQQLAKYLQSPNFNIKELKDKLQQLKTAEPAQSSLHTSGTVQPAKPAPKPEPTEQKPVAKPKPVPKPSQKPTPKLAPKAKQVPKKALNSEGDQEPTEKKKPSPIIIACLALLALAIVWRVYTTMASDSMFYISISLSLIIVAAAIYVAFIYDGKTEAVEAEVESEQNEQSGIKRLFSKDKHKEQDAETGSAAQDQAELVEPVATEAPVDAATYFQELENQTTLLSQPNATVLLDEDEGDDAAPAVAYLAVNRQGKTEKITISRDPFLIGRNAASVDYMEDSVGVSRTHLELIQTEQGYSIKDLGSKNGSKKNGEAMVAYKSYSLSHGDQVTIGKVDYTFQKD